MTNTILYLLAAFAAGLVCGVLLEDAYELLKKGWTEMHSTTSRERPTRVTMFWVITIFALAQLLVGAFIIYDNNRDRKFETCVFRYTQQFAESYKAVSRAAAAAQSKRFDWEEVLPRFFKNGGTEEDRKEFQKKYNGYVKFYKDLTKERVANPYPALPREYCGAPSED